jgi:hypothetical protein
MLRRILAAAIMAGALLASLAGCASTGHKDHTSCAKCQGSAQHD